MQEDPWGSDLRPVRQGAPAPLPPRLAALADLATEGRTLRLEPGERWVFPAASELPEVQQLAVRGWHPAPDAPYWHFLPAVWPGEHRCWLPDRLPRVSVVSNGTDGVIVPWTEELAEEQYAQTVAEAREAGLPAPPRGRLWLLRSPWPSIGFAVALRVIDSFTQPSGAPRPGEDRRRVAAVRQVLSWPEEELWSRWHGASARTAAAWRARGRTGEEVSDLILEELSPELMARLATPTSRGGAGLDERQAIAWTRTVYARGNEAVTRVIAWRAHGLPADPPRDDHDVLADMTPADLDAWEAAGFGFAELGAWWPVGLNRAQAWRAAGFTAQETARLLSADPRLTPEEALAFETHNIGRDWWERWVESGFTAPQARAWTDLDIFPGEARVWRSMQLGPEEARRRREAGSGPLPDGAEAGWFDHGHRRDDRHYGVVDPPGTRGRLAQQA